MDHKFDSRRFIGYPWSMCGDVWDPILVYLGTQFCEWTWNMYLCEM